MILENFAQRSTNYFLKLIAVSVGHFLNDFYMNLIPPILFLFSNSMGLTLSQQAFIAFVITSSGSFFQPFIGYVVDRSGKPWLLAVSLVWIAFWMSLSGIVSNYYLLIVFSGLGALASALFHPLGSAVAVNLTTKSRGTSLSIFMTIGGFAASVSPVVAIPVVKAYGLSSLVFFVFPGILVALFMYYARVQDVEMKKNTDENVKKAINLNIIENKFVSLLVLIASNRVLIRSFLITFGVQVMLLKGVSLEIAGIVLSAFLFLNSAGTIVGGFLDDKLGSKKVMILFNLLNILFMALIVLADGFIMILGFLMIGFTLSGSNTSNIVMAYDLMPENMNTATGLMIGFAAGIGSLIMLLFGKIADIQGLIAGTAWLLVPTSLTILIATILPKSSPSN